MIGKFLFGKLAHFSRHANCRDRDLAGADVETFRIMQDADRLHHVGIVRQRLAHAHEDDVGDALAAAAASMQIEPEICSTICAADRFPLTPLIPLAQNLQPTGQPTCELTHAVRRSPSGIITVSALPPFGQVSSSFAVPSELCC